MTPGEIILNLVLGLVSGGVSGYIVSLFFKKNQDKRDWLLAFENDKQNLNNFLYALSIEMDILIDDTKNGLPVDIKEAKRIFSHQPRTLTFSNNLTKESSGKLLKARELVNEIEDEISPETKLNKLHYYRKELFKARIDVLSITSEKY